MLPRRPVRPPRASILSFRSKNRLSADPPCLCAVYASRTLHTTQSAVFCGTAIASARRDAAFVTSSSFGPRSLHLRAAATSLGVNALTSSLPAILSLVHPQNCPVSALGSNPSYGLTTRLGNPPVPADSRSLPLSCCLGASYISASVTTPSCSRRRQSRFSRSIFGIL